MHIKGPVRAIGVAKPIRYPYEIQVELHFQEPVPGIKPGQGLLLNSCTIEQMWSRYRPVHIDDRKRIEEILSTGEKANLGEVVLRDFELEDEPTT